VGFFATSGILNRKGFFRGGFDPDASAFFATAGVTNQAARGQINAFVFGVKDLGLWSSMVSWPLRSTQNAGTGTTVYSLGGYGINDGTMNGTISWGADGIIYPNDSTFKFINTGFTMAYDSSNSSFAVGSLTATSSGNRRYIGSAAQPATPLNAGVSANTTTLSSISSFSGSVFTQVSFAGSPNLNTFNWLGASANYATTTNNFNAQLNSTFGTLSRNSAANGKNALHIGGGQSVADTFTGTMAFASYFPTTDVSQANKLLLYNLYKNTLGQGLGLP
jgi:hypothetical protein